MDANLITVLTAIGGSLGGAFTVGWLSKFLIKNLIRENEKKHDKTSEALKTVSDKLAEISSELCAIKATLEQVAMLKGQVSEDHDMIIVNIDRFSLEKTFSTNGDLNFLQFAQERYNKPVFFTVNR